MPLSHLPRTLTLIANRICHSEFHSDVTIVHRMIPLAVVHCPCTIVPPTLLSARPNKSSHVVHLNPSSQGVEILQRASPAALHATACSNWRIGPKKCESYLCAMHMNSEGSTNSLPSPSCRQHPLSSRETVSAPKP